MKRAMKSAIGCVFFVVFFNATGFAQPLPPLLDAKINQAASSKQKMISLTEAALWSLDSLANANLAKKYAWEAKEIAIADGFDCPVELHFVVARIYDRMMAPYSGLLEIEQALKKINPGNYQLMAQAKNYLAILSLHMGKFMDARNEFLKNLEYAEIYSLKMYEAEALRGLADTYNGIGDREMERKYINLYLEKLIELGKKTSIASAYFRLGEFYLTDSVFDESGMYYKKSYQIYTNLHDTNMMAHSLLRIAWVEYLKKDLDNSIKLFTEALQYAEISNNPVQITNALGNLGTIYRDKGDDSTAMDFYLKSIGISRKIKDYYNLSWVYQDMSNMFAQKGNFEKAFGYFKMYKTYNDSVETFRYRRGLEQARMLYESERKQQELQMLSLKLQQHRSIFYGIAALIVLLFIIVVLVFRQIKVNTRRKMAEMNQKIAEMTQKNLQQQMNPHFIFNTLNSIQYYMYQHDKMATNDYMSKFSRLMRKTLENSRFTAIPVKDELEALTLYLELEALRFKNKFNYTVTIDEDIDVVMHKIPTMLIQPYVENAICHGLMHKEEQGTVSVDMRLEENTIVCTIHDNGIGREAALKIKNSNNGQHESLGTTITESRLKLVHSLYGSSMKIEYQDLKSEDGTPQGTKVIIYIPIIT